MGYISAILSEITCGEACWSAKGDVCHCECGGRNHGINLRGETAERTAKIDGVKYKLLAVGTHKQLSTEAHEINKQIITSAYWDTSYKVFKIHTADHLAKGAAARLRYATVAQINKWAELEAFKGRDRYRSDAALLWIRVDHEDFQKTARTISDADREASALMRELSISARARLWYETLFTFIGKKPLTFEARVWTNAEIFSARLLETAKVCAADLEVLKNESFFIDSGYEKWWQENK